MKARKPYTFIDVRGAIPGVTFPLPCNLNSVICNDCTVRLQGEHVEGLLYLYPCKCHAWKIQRPLNVCSSHAVGESVTAMYYNCKLLVECTYRKKLLMISHFVKLAMPQPASDG